ncbi:hypothetical protein QVD17_36656 [Tagetes erecta]|uniref:Uncharacterized protein n=1 Tax=Tagetes erecta TaxID=13708 RepID=A0AAD8JUJ0_TARER|nr:hypothetical protein QVD17_36656 [Tagetes erecta]
MQQEQIDDLGFSPSFSCYSSNSLTSTAAIKISNQLQQQQQQQQSASFHDCEDDEFEFSFIRDEEVSETDDAVKQKLEEENDCSDALQKLFINEQRDFTTASSSSSESEVEHDSPEKMIGFCAWRYKTDAGASPLSKCKKSGSTGSGSKRWRIRHLLRRSNSEGKVPPAVEKKCDGEGLKVAVKLKPSIHELLYVQQRGKKEDGKRKTYLPYRKELVGFFTNVNGSGLKLPF